MAGVCGQAEGIALASLGKEIRRGESHQPPALAPQGQAEAHLGARATDAMGAYATSIFMIGWATGGVVFGILGDRIGRVRTMVWTILCYTFFTGLRDRKSTRLNSSHL